MPRKIPIHASKRVKYFAFRGRLYRQNEDRPFFANIMIQDTAPKLKQMHSAFGDIFPRSYIYDYRVVILEGRSSHEFQISCKKTIGLEYNKVLQKLGGQWNGDIVVMRIGKKNPSNPVDMGGKDAGRADFAVKKSVKPNGWGRSPLLPKALSTENDEQMNIPVLTL
ncbi:hypothetical protein CPB84DRAFT_1752740 [Gymnopilus junonius]|uniref:Uncharacterized protein n=1 Tax=Gymnopilus junonius TaxID=109634 RepID=A0A9P5TH12_GYMJU|nr:hypothetical protein CPB84DRAFT_1752740 [Gymnopilus junonius]